MQYTHKSITKNVYLFIQFKKKKKNIRKHKKMRSNKKNKYKFFFSGVTHHSIPPSLSTASYVCFFWQQPLITATRQNKNTKRKCKISVIQFLLRFSTFMSCIAFIIFVFIAKTTSSIGFLLISINFFSGFIF